ncbi:MAG TPA: carbonic anhydrase [Candidatus Binataceae bacterium]|nr:carbonic anhydrase [Candidatus Binataceae bacterium]
MKKALLPLLVLLALVISPIARGDSDVKAPPSDQVIRQLLEGNERFVAQKATHPDSAPSDAAQHPLAVILSCSDSRVPPEMVFDQGVGKLFVVRDAGNTYDRLALLSIDYAVEHLGTRLILVMGHDQCGAVTAAVKAYPQPKLGPVVENIYPAVRAAEKMPGDKVSNAIDENAILMAQKLCKEPEFAKMIASHELTILPARYNLATGRVRILQK